MALARQAQRCAVGKLGCYCGCRYRDYHDDPDGVQIVHHHEQIDKAIGDISGESCASLRGVFEQPTLREPRE